MATSSITKEFVVRDEEVFTKLVNELNQLPDKKMTVKETSSLIRGREKLKQFSFR